MTWSTTGAAPAVSVLIRTPAVVLPVDDVAGLPPATMPVMRLLAGAGPDAPELSTPARRTVSGNVVFPGLDWPAGRPPPVAALTYRLMVEPDAVLRPDRPDGYPIVVPPDLAGWPVRIPVVLLAGPAYPYLRHVPVVHGRVLDPAGAPLADAVVTVLDTGAPNPPAPFARAATDHLGRFSAGLPRLASDHVLVLRAAAGGTTGADHPLAPADFHRSVDLTVP